jgi:hypothetical protein
MSKLSPSTRPSKQQHQQELLGQQRELKQYKDFLAEVRQPWL